MRKVSKARKMMAIFFMLVLVFTTPTFMLIDKANVNDKANAESEKLYNIENLYPLSTTVTDVNYNTDTVTCTDFNGNKWEFKGCEDWQKGDIASLIMNDNDTEIIYDDDIIKAEYNGWVY